MLSEGGSRMVKTGIGQGDTVVEIGGNLKVVGKGWLERDSSNY